MPNGRNEGRLYPERETLDLLERVGTDGQKWADECTAVLLGENGGRVFCGAEREELVGLLTGWFANAIEKGKANPDTFSALDPEEMRDVATEVLEHNATFGTDFDRKINAVAAELKLAADRREKADAGS